MAALHRWGAVTPPVPARPALRLSPSALVLVAANLVPLAGVLFFGWTVFATLLLGHLREHSTVAYDGAVFARPYRP